MLSQKLVRGSLFVGTLVPSSTRPTRRHPNPPHAETSADSLERTRTENGALRQRLTEQGKLLRHTMLLLDASRAENTAMRRNIAELMQAQAAPALTSGPRNTPGVQA
ncbi:hypothetical protein CDEF62S_01749 [Castellaniella defragrans]